MFEVEDGGVGVFSLSSCIYNYFKAQSRLSEFMSTFHSEKIGPCPCVSGTFFFCRIAFNVHRVVFRGGIGTDSRRDKIPARKNSCKFSFCTSPL